MYANERPKDNYFPLKFYYSHFIEANIDNMGKFDRIKHALTIFGFEDELSIKYAD